MYRASTFNVMIASPGDVEAERRAARDVVHEWNAVHSADRSIVLLPIAWESHASPEMGDRPQGVINRQILEDCDLLVAIFWTRLGTPTGRNLSGTVEEIEEHLEAGKPAMIYFSTAPVHPDSVETSQLHALREFRVSCKERGLVQEFASLREFREVFTRQLAQTVIRSLHEGSTYAPDESEKSPVLAVERGEEQPRLSIAAQELLLEAGAAADGTIVCVGTLGGFFVQAGERDFVERGDPRSEAKWRGAVQELERESLIEDQGYKGEVYRITHAGFGVIDSLS